MTSLESLIRSIDDLPEDHCICAKRPWLPAAEAVAVRLNADGCIPARYKDAGYEYFLEVHVIQDEVFGEPTGKLSADEQFEMVKYYAENDALPEWSFLRVESKQG